MYIGTSSFVITAGIPRTFSPGAAGTPHSHSPALCVKSPLHTQRTFYSISIYMYIYIKTPVGRRIMLLMLQSRVFDIFRTYCLRVRLFECRYIYVAVSFINIFLLLSKRIYLLHFGFCLTRYYRTIIYNIQRRYQDFF